MESRINSPSVPGAEYFQEGLKKVANASKALIS